MTDKNYNELLFTKVTQEHKELVEELEKLPANEALSRAYEKVIKEDLVSANQRLGAAPRSLLLVYGEGHSRLSRQVVLVSFLWIHEPF